jgi:hypothetical protein
MPAGENMYFEAFYEGPPGWYLRNLFIAAAALVMFTLIILESRNIKRISKN